MQERNRTIQTILDRLSQSRNPMNAATDPSQATDNSITLAMAVRTLQAHERARQGRAHAHLMHKTKKESNVEESQPTDEKQFNESCLIIQTIWRQKHAEKLFNAKRIAESELLGMARISSVTRSCQSTRLFRFYPRGKHRRRTRSTTISVDFIFNSNIKKSSMELQRRSRRRFVTTNRSIAKLAWNRFFSSGYWNHGNSTDNFRSTHRKISVDQPRYSKR